MSRLLPDFLDSFMDWTEGSPSPDRFRRWAGLSCISAALKRSVYTRIVRKTQYANLYIILVGHPGSGKGVAMGYQKELIRPVKTIHLTPAAVTKRSFVRAVEETKDTITDILTGKTETVCAITGCIDELGTFIQENDIPFMEVLADLYDNPIVWDYSTQHVGEHKLEGATFNFIAGTQPRYIGRAFTNDALEMGFPARLIMVYAEPVGKVASLFADEEVDEERLLLEKRLVHDLELISQIRGRYVWEDEAAVALEAWYQDDMPPIPADSRFEHYNTRRLAHTTKLCMILAASTSNELSLTVRDFERARAVLLEAETYMPKALSRMGANPLRQHMLNAVGAIKIYYTRQGRGMPEHILRSTLGTNISPQYMAQTINELVLQKAIEKRGQEPNRVFYPKGEAGKKKED